MPLETSRQFRLFLPRYMNLLFIILDMFVSLQIFKDSIWYISVLRGIEGSEPSVAVTVVRLLGADRDMEAREFFGICFARSRKGRFQTGFYHEPACWLRFYVVHFSNVV